MRSLFSFSHRPLVPLRVRRDPDRPKAVVGRAGRGQPHTDATFAAVRGLIEGSTLSYGQIRARTGVSHATICRWAREGGWKRPPFAPRATDLMPTPRAARSSDGARSPPASTRSPSATSANWKRARASTPSSSARRWSF
jgi:hypothetical protein